ncbi:MAG: aminotransferase class V-fold PLP-dependent enzyme, partial [Woeseia sp.]
MSANSPVTNAAIDSRPMADYRADFPALSQTINGHPLVYLDSAASSQQPNVSIDAMAEYQRHSHANVHRGVHTLSHRATDIYEGARDAVKAFINARSRSEIIYTSGTTEAINLVAQSYARPNLQAGDRIVISHLEHHSNIVPWQMVCEQTGAELVVAPINERGEVVLDKLYALLDERVKLLAINYVSNALGTVNPVQEIIAEAHRREIPVLVDGAQAVPHMALDMQTLDADFFAFSGHKMFAPTGIGILYAKERLLDKMPPWKGGGDMILEVSFDGTSYNEL